MGELGGASIGAHVHWLLRWFHVVHQLDQWSGVDGAATVHTTIVSASVGCCNGG